MNIFSFLNIYFDNIQHIIMVFWAYFEYNYEINVPIEPLWLYNKLYKYLNNRLVLFSGANKPKMAQLL